MKTGKDTKAAKTPGGMKLHSQQSLLHWLMHPNKGSTNH